MPRPIAFLLAAMILPAAASAAFAQADAAQAYAEAKAAYEAGNYAEARQAAERASQTDPNNAEVFLLLGKAHYQLGELDKAMAAWRRTLALAPEEPYARQMLDALRGRLTDYDARLRLVRLWIDGRLFAPAAQECASLLGEAALGDAQRAAVWLLQAEIALGQNQPAEALRVVGVIRVRAPETADTAMTDLWEGVAKLRTGGPATAEGLERLANVLKLPAENPAVAIAEYELAVFRLGQGVTPERAEALAAWLDAHESHPLAEGAVPTLLSAYMALSRLAGPPKPDAPLGRWDVRARALVEQAAARAVRAGEVEQLFANWLKHVEEHYAAAGAYQAAAAAVEPPAVPVPVPAPDAAEAVAPGGAADWPRDVRLAALRALGRYRLELAIKDLEERLLTGALAAEAEPGPLPRPIVAVAAVYQRINDEFPDQPAWNDLAWLAARVQAYSTPLGWPPSGTTLTAPDAWAIELALPVIRADADRPAVQKAVELFHAMIQDYSQPDAAAAQSLRVELSRRLIDAPLSPDHPAWSEAMFLHAERLGEYAQFLFEENLKAGKAAENAKPSPPLLEMLDVLGRLVARDAGQAEAALELVQSDVVVPWNDHGHAEVVDAVFGRIVEMLPLKEKHEAELAWVRVWIDRVRDDHERLAAAGLRVPRRLDPLHAEALKRLYAMQAGLPDGSELLGKIRWVWKSIPAVYHALDYDEVAAEAIALKAEPAVPEADELAAFDLAWHHGRVARRELSQALQQYGAREDLELSAAFRDVIAAWQQFITDYPASSLVPDAAEQVFGVGRLYEQQQAFDAAAAIYADFAEFAAGVPVLAQTPPDGSSTAQRAHFTRAAALGLKAHKVLTKALAERKEGDPPPDALSAEFATAIGAYLAYIEAHPASPLVGESLDRIMAVALEYAKHDAWGVAEGVFDDLLGWKLEIARPERLEFARGVCRLGRAMPEHARQVLGVLAGGGWRSSGETPAPPRRPAPPETPPDPFAAPAGPVPPADPFGPAVAGPVPQPATVAVPPPPPAGGTLALPGPDATLSGGALRLPADDAPLSSRADAARDSQLLAMIRQQESSRAQQVAQLREQVAYQPFVVALDDKAAAQGQLMARLTAVAPALSEAELRRQEDAIAAAYDIFQAVRAEYPTTPTAEQARGEILLMVGHWRGLGQWDRAAALAARYLADNPADRELPKLRLEIARDLMAFATKPLERGLARQAMLAEASKRFAAARDELGRVVADFPDEKAYRQQAQWDIATSHLTEARVVAALSPTLARGQFVRAAKELQRVAEEFADHPRVGEIAQMLWDIAAELENRGFDDEAIVVWSDLMIYDPLAAQARQAAMKIGQTYHRKLNRPLRAAEIYQEQFFAWGADDQGLQDAVFQIGSELKDRKRWVEAMHVLETFVDSFPRHPQAGQALTMVGQIHQTNEAWEDAIGSYKRVIAEFDDGPFVQEAKWAIAECTINLSRWQEASRAYADFAAAYPQDGRVAEANRRVEVLKDLVRYQGLVDEKDQRRAFDAQYQIAEIVRRQLNNPVKAVIEYRKVVDGWPQSHLADNALYEAGATLLGLGEVEKGRRLLRQVAEKYPTSPLADDALLLVGQSYEQEAQRLATVTRETTLARNWEVSQRFAYEQARAGARRQQEVLADRVASLKQAGKGKEAEVEEASAAAQLGQFNVANVMLFAQKAEQDVEAMTAAQLADRQDKINAALRKAVEAYQAASQVPGADKADDALLAMATIYDEQLKDSKAAMQTWLEIVRQFSGTSVAEDASWRIAQYYQREGEYAEAVKAFEQFFRNYRRSPKAGDAQFAVAENYERLGQWVAAMDAYTNYINNFPDGPLVGKAREQINWIKTYRL
jgi:TolA-binding protein